MKIWLLQVEEQFNFIIGLSFFVSTSVHGLHQFYAPILNVNCALFSTTWVVSKQNETCCSSLCCYTNMNVPSKKPQHRHH
mmetsp:Transcript_25132/g.37220  ORF Transcript_25132/g.37220 Transcript_25132/m.37220 type:complete len:80 (-) Transcript_25132:171-410(-)